MSRAESDYHCFTVVCDLPEDPPIGKFGRLPAHDNSHPSFDHTPDGVAPRERLGTLLGGTH